MSETKPDQVFLSLLETISALRNPDGGCPWDLEQTHKSLRPYLLEETHEVLEAIDAEDDENFCDELGDVLLQVVLHAHIAKQRDAFTICDVIHSVNEKMIRRHPHVFGDKEANSAQEVLENWELIKGAEKNETQTELPQSERLRKIPGTLPALTRAQRIGEKAASMNFDWDALSGVLAKVREEIAELEAELPDLEEEISQKQRDNLEHELGDVLFSLSQLARWLGINAEDSARLSCSRFIQRFEVLEQLTEKAISDYEAEELEALWQKAKGR